MNVRPLLACVLALTASLAFAQTEAEDEAALALLSTDSPKEAMDAFLTDVKGSRYEQASSLMMLAPAQQSRGADLARRLRFVLDHHGQPELGKLSAADEGKLDDKLPANRERVASFPTERGTAHLDLLRTNAGWRISRASVLQIDAWFSELPDAFILDRLPDALLRNGPGGLLIWQWLALIVAFSGSLVVGVALSAILRRVFRGIARRTRFNWDDLLIERISGPLTLVCTAIALQVFIPLVGLPPDAKDNVRTGLHIFFIAAGFWAALRSVTVISEAIQSSGWAQANPTSRTLVPLGARTASVAVLALAAVTVLSQLGYPVASLIAGLGLGGLAFALAAQKTVENLFGAYAIGLDQPLREGDFVKVEDFTGTVERIGLRSTRVRTQDRTVVSLPNSKIADMKLENFAVRDRIRLNLVLGLVYSTTVPQMRNILEALRAALLAAPKIGTENVICRFVALNTYSLDIEVVAWFETTDFNEFASIRQELLFRFMEIVEAEGSSFAFPTQTQDTPPDQRPVTTVIPSRAT